MLLLHVSAARASHCQAVHVAVSHILFTSNCGQFHCLQLCCTAMCWSRHRHFFQMCCFLSPQHGASSGCGWMNGLQIWRVTANILKKPSPTADRGWSFSLGLDEVLTTSRRKNLTMLRNGYMGLGFERALVNAVMNLRFP
jgi:hypothetical protein